MSQAQLDKLLTIFEKMPTLGSMSLEQERANLDEGGARFLVPDDVTREVIDADGVPAEYLVAPGAADDKVVLYLHGGGYVIGSIKSHRYLMQNISRHSGAKTLGIDYRLAPKNPSRRPWKMPPKPIAGYWLKAIKQKASPLPGTLRVAA